MKCSDITAYNINKSEKILCDQIAFLPLYSSCKVFVECIKVDLCDSRNVHFQTGGFLFSILKMFFGSLILKRKFCIYGQ